MRWDEQGSETVKALAFSPPNEVELKIEGLAKMQRLKLLQLCNVKVKGSYEDFPKNLVWLSWRGFSLKYIPASFDLDKLAVLDMPNSNLKFLWERNRVLHERGIFSIYLPGSEIPGWYSYQNAGPKISFIVNHVQGRTIIGLNLCVVYAFDQSANLSSNDKIFCTPFTHMANRTKGLFWNYSPTFYEIPGEQACNLWLSHWKYVDQLEDGDEVVVVVGMPPGEVKRVGVHLVYEEKDDSQSQSINSSSWYKSLSNADMSAMYLARYVLGYSQHDHVGHKLRWDALIDHYTK
ncbi:hypothetical protein GH714_020281 [Hevea brasiliensis]|uniref:C-JID domain-containing protein n=1 Tax=Hevea brasiliensis TaxID=3981 RepID=A0A6A6MTZ5_HEVBR|nr:hypothetical protein GH714_020281 [Hevea brasiliensis]